MVIHIIGSFDRNTIYCAGSVTKLLTTYVCLSLLSEKYELKKILDDENFFDALCTNRSSREFLTLFQHLIKSKFTLRDICSYYAGLPYTFEPSDNELEKVDAGHPFKHHSIPDEKTFLYLCHQKIFPVYPDKKKFHYSEISIIFIGYFLEQVYQLKIESLYQKYILDRFQLKNSAFSRKRVEGVYTQDLSDRYDSASIAIMDHGYFCYSNGFYTTLNDMKRLLEHFMKTSVFHEMVNIQNARAASNRLMNGLTIEIRKVGEDFIYGYEGLSFSGCNLWAYSTLRQCGYITFNNNEEETYKIIYDELFGYKQFDKVPEHTEKIYKQFIETYHDPVNEKTIPKAFQGSYQRVNINEKRLKNIFTVGENYIIVRSPDEIRYEIVYVDGNYCIKGKDTIHGSKIGFYQVKSGNHYMFYDGTLYKKS